MSKKEEEVIEQTKEHIENVGSTISVVKRKLGQRQRFHDATKIKSPEIEYFTKFTPKLKDATYGSEEYKGFLAGMKPALDHHYANNRHHPEHFDNGINGMNLVDIVEMMCDWKASSARHADGNIRKSLEINRGRFNIDAQLYQILLNTIEYLNDDWNFSLKKEDLMKKDD